MSERDVWKAAAPRTGQAESTAPLAASPRNSVRRVSHGGDASNRGTGRFPPVDAAARRLAHTATCVRDVRSSLARMCSTCARTVPGLTTSSAAICRFVSPLISKFATSSSRGLS